MTRWVKETETAVGHAVDVAAVVAVRVERVVAVVGVAVPARRTTGSPFVTETQIWPLLSAVTVAPLP